MRATFLLTAAALAAAGCSTIKQNQGYIVDAPLLASVQPGVDNKSSVEKTLGRPTFGAEFDANEWYYVSRNTRQIAFLQPKAQTQAITKITFDGKGNVAKVETRGLELAENIHPVRDKTATLGRKQGLLEDIFGGVGALGSGAVQNDSAGGTQTGRDGPR
ncbi:MAG: outer membrane protein assembly factor BamE [Sphingomonadaceae bacterium]|nr:outer membrane protein assembly factor BamE [Sphingomonadaceae bacterium]